MVDSESGNPHVASYSDAVLERCGTCRAFDKAPRVPIVGASTASAFSEKVQVGLLFLDDISALRAMEMFPGYSLLPSVHCKNPQGV